ncbi:hypothetical protein B4914_08415 [Yersinia entomophaga]|nr:hypothetical protein B4914_08415 [Yersinia entomophaga]
MTSVTLHVKPQKTVIAIAGGHEKHQAIKAALKGQWVNGLATDE